MAQSSDVIVIGAGAAGLMCAATAASRGRSVKVLDMGKKIGRKILISGGGRCNFTNMYAEPECYLSQNPHFCKSALSQYTQWDFIGLVSEHGMPYHEKTLGQLFCDNGAKDVVQILQAECDKYGVEIVTRCEVLSVEKGEQRFTLETSQGSFNAASLVVACGGLSMPGLGVSPLGYKLAEQFGLELIPTKAALVPLTLHQDDKQRFADLSGISVPAIVTTQDGTSFKENILFTHRGLSGPAILQASSYWTPGEKVSINLCPELDLSDALSGMITKHPKQALKNSLSRLFPKRFIEALIEEKAIPDVNLNQLNEKQVKALVDYFENWQLLPNGTEGYRTAEVTLGGVNTDGLSSKTMEAKQVPGLFFIGEVVDVTGWLGGYNFQWAWSSGWVAGQHC